MMHGYFKMGKVSCRIVSDTSLFMCKICVPAASRRVPAVSMVCLCTIVYNGYWNNSSGIYEISIPWPNMESPDTLKELLEFMESIEFHSWTKYGITWHMKKDCRWVYFPMMQSNHHYSTGWHEYNAKQALEQLWWILWNLMAFLNHTWKYLTH